MTRTILVHVNVQVPDEDTRTPEEIGTVIEGAIDVGLDTDDEELLADIGDLVVSFPLVEELGARP